MIDTHCHFDLYPNPLEIITEAEKLGITVIGMTLLPSHFEQGFSHIQPFKKIRLALGLHPLYAQKHQNEYKAFLDNVSKTSYIGEVGLDFSKEGLPTKDIQLRSFRFILESIDPKAKVLSVHSRGAEIHTLELLKEYNISNVIFHWYTGIQDTMFKILDQGYYFSINPQMVFSQKGQQIIKSLPIDRVLAESDGPFAQINNKISIPFDVKLVYNFLSNIHNISSDNTIKLVKNNFHNLLYSLHK